MKTLLFVLLLSSEAHANFSPKVITTIDEDKTIHIEAINESDDPVHCRWTVSWFESLLSYKSFHGLMDIFPASSESLEFKNDPNSKVYNLKSNFDCL
jgi:hypothetical protein